MPVKRSVANNEEEEKETHKNKIHRLVANPDGKTQNTKNTTWPLVVAAS